MIVNSAKEYRQWIKKQEDRNEVNEDFIGCSYDDKGQKRKGFFNLFHGMKDDIEKYLPSLLDIAEDNQAIYEFLQNAVDCGATHFWAFYNDQYFLAVNNGKKFTLDGISSILNIAQSTKSTASSIGRLGIGFKLAHRLVGKGNGTYELVHANKGPIMFSWDKHEQLRDLMSSEPILYKGLDNNPFLFKIVITNFPTNAGEVVKDINYKDSTIFEETELIELRSYVSQCLRELYSGIPTSFDQGTLFFIKLGENKKQLLDGDLETLQNGIEYSMNTLKQLENICFNGKTIEKKQLVIEANSIEKSTDTFKEIDPQYKDYDILYSFGYIPFDFTSKEYYQTAEQLRQSPNFYKYFPMGDEVDNMALFIHSDSFQIEANRRKLINHHTNKMLLPVIAKDIIETLALYKEKDKNKYYQLYASILLTDKPYSQEKSWMQSVFFDYLFTAIKGNIPTTSGNSTNPDFVKIKKVKMDIPLDQIGLANYSWFYWYGDEHKEIITEAARIDKLGLKEWNINNIIENVNIDLLNKWLKCCSIELFDLFISEIHSITTSKAVRDSLPQIKLFKIGDERKSRNEIDENIDYVITTNKNLKIKPILEKIGMKCTEGTIENHLLNSLLKVQEEKTLFYNIKEKLEDEQNWIKLLPVDKILLITTLKGFENVGDESIKQLKIFKNIDGKKCALKDLIAYKESVELWQRPYVICEEECFSEIHSLLISSENIFTDIVDNHYDDIINERTSINDLYSIYQKNGVQWTDNLTIKMIGTYGCTDEVLSLIEKNPSKTAVEEFVNRLDSLKIISTCNYLENSYEYRCIKVAAKVNSISIRNKILIDGIKLTDFTSSNELKFNLIGKDGIVKTYTIKLSDVLPNDTQCALYGKVAEKFSSITDYSSIFSADSSNSNIVQTRLRTLLTPENTIILPAQFIFILFTRWQNNYPSLNDWDSIVRFGKTTTQIGITIASILDYAFRHNLTDVLVQYKSIYTWSQHVKGRYMFSTDYTLENERAYKEIEDWCGDDFQKKEILKKLDVHFDDGAEIKRRKQFKENTLSEWEGAVFPEPFLAWVASLQNVDGENQKKLLFYLTNKFNNVYLKRAYIEEDYNDAKELYSAKYLAWKSSKSISIYGLSIEMPVRIMYNKEKVLARLNVGPYKYFPETKHLYINGVKEEEIASVLAQVYQDKTIPFDYQDYTSVCFDSYEEQRMKDEKIRMYEELISLMTESQQEQQEENIRTNEEYRNEYTSRVKEFMGGDFSMPSDKVKSEHIISRYRILMYIKSLERFTIKPEFDEKSFIRTDGYASIPLLDGKHINIQSAKFGIWYLSPVIWNDIVEKGNYACLCTGNGEDDFMLIKNVDDIKSIAESKKNVFMRLTPTSSTNIIDTIKSVFSSNNIACDDGINLGTIHTKRDVHLMLMVHTTVEPLLNSMFDNVFKAEGDYNIIELG